MDFELVLRPPIETTRLIGTLASTPQRLQSANEMIGDMERLLEWPSEQASPSTRREIIAWWEAHRFRFNLYVGIVGAVSWLLVLIVGSAAVKPGVDFEEPIAMIIGPFVYGVLANICFTFGWIVDTVSYRGSPRTRLYRAGIVFSVVLTSLPGVWAVVAWLKSLCENWLNRPSAAEAALIFRHLRHG